MKARLASGWYRKAVVLLCRRGRIDAGATASG